MLLTRSKTGKTMPGEDVIITPQNGSMATHFVLNENTSSTPCLMSGQYIFIYIFNHHLEFQTIHHPSPLIIHDNTGWWFFATPSEKYEFVNWDDDRNPIFLGKFKKWQPNQQPAITLWYSSTTGFRAVHLIIPLLKPSSCPKSPQKKCWWTQPVINLWESTTISWCIAPDEYYSHDGSSRMVSIYANMTRVFCWWWPWQTMKKWHTYGSVMGLSSPQIFDSPQRCVIF